MRRNIALTHFCESTTHFDGQVSLSRRLILCDYKQVTQQQEMSRFPSCASISHFMMIPSMQSIVVVTSFIYLSRQYQEFSRSLKTRLTWTMQRPLVIEESQSQDRTTDSVDWLGHCALAMFTMYFNSASSHAWLQRVPDILSLREQQSQSTLYCNRYAFKAA